MRCATRLAIYEKNPHESTFDLAISYHNLGGLQNEARTTHPGAAVAAASLELKQQINGPRSAQLISTLTGDQCRTPRAA